MIVRILSTRAIVGLLGVTAILLSASSFLVQAKREPTRGTKNWFRTSSTAIDDDDDSQDNNATNATNESITTDTTTDVTQTVRPNNGERTRGHQNSGSSSTVQRQYFNDPVTRKRHYHLPIERDVDTNIFNVTNAPSMTPSVVLSNSPSWIPSQDPTGNPTSTTPNDTSTSPSLTPSSLPSMVPSLIPSTNQPSENPTTTNDTSEIPSVVPTFSPSDVPSNRRSSIPSIIPSVTPSSLTNGTSTFPSVFPSEFPSTLPISSSAPSTSFIPSELPSTFPSQYPSNIPSLGSLPSTSPIPNGFPSTLPSQYPSNTPSLSSVPSTSSIPSELPSTAPSQYPSNIPSLSSVPSTSSIPSELPLILPSQYPSNTPSLSSVPSTSSIPSELPVTLPSQYPSNTPSLSSVPSTSSIPSELPSTFPSQYPSKTPSLSSVPSTSSSPSELPSTFPSQYPSNTPSLSSVPSTSSIPSELPSTFPSQYPSNVPSLSSAPSTLSSPSELPSTFPSQYPSSTPSLSSVPSTSSIPSELPSTFPSQYPSSTPSLSSVPSTSSIPSEIPSTFPSQYSSNVPSSVPSVYPSTSSAPSISSAPSAFPSGVPSSIPSISSEPSKFVTQEPTTTNLTGKNAWLDTGKFYGENSGDTFGQSVSISYDGQIISIGAIAYDTTNDKGAVVGQVGQVSVYQVMQVANLNTVDQHEVTWTLLGNPIVGSSTGDYLGWSTSLSNDGTIIAIGAPQFLADTQFGRVHIYNYISNTTNNTSDWVPLGQTLVGETDGNFFGSAVELSDDGLTVAVASAEHVQIFYFEDATSQWVQRGETLSVGKLLDVSISGHGETVAIGQPNTDAGHVIVYRWDITNGTWKILGTNATGILGELEGDQFGFSVSLSTDGNIVAACAPYHDGEAGDSSGRVRVFEYHEDTNDSNNDTWILLGSPIVSEYAGDGFANAGMSVSLSGQGNFLAIGTAIQATRHAGNNNQGGTTSHVRIFNYDLEESVWRQLGKDVNGEAAGDEFGGSVSISGGGTSVVVGARKNDKVGVDAGQAKVYMFGVAPNSQSPSFVPTIVPSSVPSTFPSQDPSEEPSVIPSISPSIQPSSSIMPTLEPSLSVSPSSSPTHLSFNWTQLGQDVRGQDDKDFLGVSISLSSDGTAMAVGADGKDSFTGSVRVYVLNTTKALSSPSWVQRGQELRGSADDDQFGFSTSLSDDGTTVAIGTPQSFFNGNGLAQVYRFNSSSLWEQMGNDIVGEGSSDEAGYSISLSSSGLIVAVGAILYNGDGKARGQCRIFSFSSSSSWEQIGQSIIGQDDAEKLGSSVSLSSNGTMIAIGSEGKYSSSGSVRVYQLEEDETTTSNSFLWNQIGQEILGQGGEDDTFGYSLDLSGDGTTVIIGAPQIFANGNLPGYVQVYELEGTDSNNKTHSSKRTWAQVGDTLVGEQDGEEAGYSVALSHNGSTIIIGSIGYGEGLINSGVSRIYTTVSSSTTALLWNQVGQSIQGGMEGSFSGWSVSMSYDGLMVGIGAPGDNSDRGLARVHELLSFSSTNSADVTTRIVNIDNKNINNHEDDNDNDTIPRVRIRKRNRIRTAARTFDSSSDDRTMGNHAHRRHPHFQSLVDNIFNATIPIQRDPGGALGSTTTTNQLRKRSRPDSSSKPTAHRSKLSLSHH